MNALVEVWKEVPRFGGHYEASSLGRIRSKAREVIKRDRYGNLMRQVYKARVLRGCPGSRTGHLRVRIGLNGSKINVPVHLMVLLAFVGPRPEGMEACHNNGIATDNRPENLRWDSHLNNNRDRLTHGTYAMGEDHPMVKLNREQVLAIRSGGKPAAEVLRTMGISTSQYFRIRRGENWRHIP